MTKVLWLNITPILLNITPGCVYAEEGDAIQSPFCFKENGDNLSYCLSGSKLLAPMGALYVTVNYYRSATTETFTFITQPIDPIGHPIPPVCCTPSLLILQSTGPPKSTGVP